MKKKTVHRVHRTPKKKAPLVDYLVIVRSWMLIVVFALLLGLGAIMGRYLNLYLSGTAPTVAGVQTQR